MRKSVIVFLVCLTFASSFSCKKIIKAVFPGFETTIPDVTVTLPAIIIAPPDEVDLGEITQAFNVDDTVRARTAGVFNANDISSVKVTRMELTLENADANNNVANFESARLTLHSNNKTDPQEIASITFPDEFRTSSTFTSTNPPELKDYLKGNQLIYHIYGKLRRPTTKPLKLKVLATITIR